MTERVVTNSTCLIGLERIERLDILPQVFNSVFAPPAVAKEVRTSLDWLKIQAVANPSVVIALRTQMDEGEAEAIALSLELENVLLILDVERRQKAEESI
ncbi:MAG: hypothetical protein ACRC1Z_03675 [Waterburya sp.]